MESEVIECYRKAGKISADIRNYIKSFVKKDMLLIDIAEKVESKIIELGGDIAFPINLSVNEVAAHYTPSSSDKKTAQGILKVDWGVEVEGYIADAAISLDLTEEKKFREMIELNDRALENVLSRLKVSSVVKDIGNHVYEIVEENEEGYNIVKNLSGHSLEQYEIHAGLTISNYPNTNLTSLKDEAFAIEPFLTKGKGEVYEGPLSEIYILESDKQVRDRDARKLLDFIKDNYKTKPFCKRWLEKQNFPKLNFLLSLLVREKVLHNFPVLIEMDKKPVSQSEHTVIIHDKVEVITKG